MIEYITHPKLRFLAVIVGIFILLGVALFTTLEDWSIIDAFYFTVATITTVGFGDLTPTHPASRVIASLFMLLTVPLLLVSVGLVTEVVHDNIRGGKNGRRKKRL